MTISTRKREKNLKSNVAESNWWNLGRMLVLVLLRR
jgi:hypothetical protein